jgi:N-ethylmaleimide reductase
MEPRLFNPISLGRLRLKHRVVMAPLTRSRAGQPGNLPTEMNAEYYRQRASAALIISEATQISQQGQGYAWTPGIHTAEQIAGWRAVADAVHAAGGKMFLQLWHVGRVSHPCFQPGGALPVAPSALPVPGKTYLVDAAGNGVWGEIPTPQALTTEGIADIVQDYRQAARNAMEAGMDGVEIHAGNGYLLDQFINSGSNHRTDAYGGSIEHRVRFLLEVVDAVAQETGADRVGVRLTPMGRFMGMGDETPEDTFGYIAHRLNDWPLAYLHLVEPAMVGTVRDEAADPLWDGMIRTMRNEYHGVLMLAGGYDGPTAEQAIADGRADIIAFGRPFIANPDLPRRLRESAALNVPDPTTFFGGTAIGYTDYLALA